MRAGVGRRRDYRHRPECEETARDQRWYVTMHVMLLFLSYDCFNLLDSTYYQLNFDIYIYNLFCSNIKLIWVWRAQFCGGVCTI